MISKRFKLDVYNSRKHGIKMILFSAAILGGLQLLASPQAKAATQTVGKQSQSVAQKVTQDANETSHSQPTQATLKSATNSSQYSNAEKQETAAPVTADTAAQSESSSDTATPEAALPDSDLSTSGTVTSSDGSTKQVANSGDTINWQIKGHVDTAGETVKKLDPTRPIYVKYTLNNGLEYEGSTVTLNGVPQTIEPTQKNDRGTNYIIWNITPPSLDDQDLNNINFAIQLTTKVKSNLVDVPALTPMVRYGYYIQNGAEVEHSNVADAYRVLFQYVLLDKNGQYITPTTFNVYDGDGNLVALAADDTGKAVTDLADATLVGFRSYKGNGSKYRVAQTDAISYEGRHFSYVGLTDDSLPLAGTLIVSSDNPTLAVRMVYREDDTPRQGTVNVHYILVDEDNNVVMQGFDRTLSGQEGDDYNVIPETVIGYGGKNYDFKNATSNSAPLTGKYAAGSTYISLVYALHMEQPTKPTDPTKPTEPTNPTNPTEPAQLAEPTEPSQPAQSVETPRPGQPVQSTPEKQVTAPGNRTESSEKTVSGRIVLASERDTMQPKTKTDKKTTLPQTSDQQNDQVATLGFMNLILGLLTWLGIRKRKED